MSDLSCLWSYETRTPIDVLLSSCQENELNSLEGILRHQISLPCSLSVIVILTILGLFQTSCYCRALLARL